MFTKIIATGSYVPERLVTNDELAGMMETSDEWIRTRTGIRERHLFEDPSAAVGAEAEGTTVSSACIAGERAIHMAEEKGLQRSEIGLCIVATCTPDAVFPATACAVADRLGLSAPAAFDLSLACTGFLAAFNTAAIYLSSGMYKNALIIGVDVMSKLLDMSDRSTSILFGDGAGALVLTSDTRFREGSDSGVLKALLRTDGSRGGVLSCRSAYLNGPEASAMHMDGRAVFEFAVREVPRLITELLDGQPEPELYILHQANYRILEAVAKRLRQPMDRFPHNIERYANTTAATIPLLLDELMREGRLHDGDTAVMAGFGAGLSLGGVLLRL